MKTTKTLILNFSIDAKELEEIISNHLKTTNEEFKKMDGAEVIISIKTDKENQIINENCKSITAEVTAKKTK